jgi:2'-5' RNA ligase
MKQNARKAQSRLNKSRPTLRLFAGIAAPHEINSRLAELVERLKPLARIRWSPASNFHITTKFIGAWPQDRLDEMKSSLSAVERNGEFPIAIRGLGFYPNARSPRVFWAGVEGGPPLANLASATDKVCARLGVEPEKRSYSPHLTLARIEPHTGLSALHGEVDKIATNEFGAFTARSFHLYLSRPGRAGSVYTSLAEFPL